MKVCILSSFEDSLSKDTGYSVRMYNLAKGLAKLGHEVHFVMPNYGVGYNRFGGINVYYVRGFLPREILAFLSMLLGVAKTSSLYFYDPIFVFKVSKIIRGADIVQIEQQSAGGIIVPIIAKVWKKTIIVDCHDVFQALRIKHVNRIRRVIETFLETITYRFADFFITVSDNEKKVLVSYGIENNRIEVIPNGVDTEHFSDCSRIDSRLVKRRYGLENFKVVVFVGNMEYLPNKEAAELVVSTIAPKVVDKVHDVKFLIIGRHQQDFNVNSPNIFFTGVVDDVAKLLIPSDLAIAPLLHGSGTRLKVVEYFSAGLPVISTTIGVEGLDVCNGVDVIIEDDVNNFASKIIELLEDEDRRTKIGSSARLLALEKYDWRTITEKLDTFLRVVLNF